MNKKYIFIGLIAIVAIYFIYKKFSAKTEIKESEEKDNKKIKELSNDNKPIFKETPKPIVFENFPIVPTVKDETINVPINPILNDKPLTIVRPFKTMEDSNLSIVKENSRPEFNQMISATDLENTYNKYC